jgi:hypothetical protein
LCLQNCSNVRTFSGSFCSGTRSPGICCSSGSSSPPGGKQPPPGILPSGAPCPPGVPSRESLVSGVLPPGVPVQFIEPCVLENFHILFSPLCVYIIYRYIKTFMFKKLIIFYIKNDKKNIYIVILIC